MDQDLVVRVQHGDRRAFEALASADYARLFRVAHGVLGDRSLAGDVTQQALLDIWRDIRRLRDPAKYAGWSHRLLVRVCYAEAKRQPKWSPSEELPPADVPSTADAFGLVADRDQLERGFRRLSMDHRVALVLHFLMDMTPPCSMRRATSSSNTGARTCASTAKAGRSSRWTMVPPKDSSGWGSRRTAASGPLSEEEPGGLHHFDGRAWSQYLPDLGIDHFRFGPDGAVWLLGGVGGLDEDNWFDLYVIIPQAQAATR